MSDVHGRLFGKSADEKVEAEARLHQNRVTFLEFDKEMVKVREEDRKMLMKAELKTWQENNQAYL